MGFPAYLPGLLWSGCRDSNPGPLDPQSSALTKLRHSPSCQSPRLPGPLPNRRVSGPHLAAHPEPAGGRGFPDSNWTAEAVSGIAPGAAIVARPAEPLSWPQDCAGPEGIPSVGLDGSMGKAVDGVVLCTSKPDHRLCECLPHRLRVGEAAGNDRSRDQRRLRRRRQRPGRRRRVPPGHPRHRGHNGRR